MKVEKFKVLLYLKKSGLDKNGKAPIMGRITLNRTMAQFGCKLSCTPKLWNPRESRLDGKSKEAVEVNAKIDKLLLAINSAYESLVERKTDFDAKAIKDLFQCSADTQMTLLKQLDAIIADIESRIGIDYKKGTLPNYQYTRLTLGLFVKKRYGTDDVAFGELDEQFIREYMDFCLDERGLALDTVRHYLAILKKTCRIAFKAGHSERYHFMHFKLPQKKENPPKALTREDFLKIRDLEIPERRKSLALTRDLFLFACYTGTAYADTVSITEENLFRDEEGSLWLKYHRKKNKMLARVKFKGFLISCVIYKNYRKVFFIRRYQCHIAGFPIHPCCLMLIVTGAEGSGGCTGDNTPDFILGRVGILPSGDCKLREMCNHVQCRIIMDITAPGISGT